jgi:hypothetical protein
LRRLEAVISVAQKYRDIVGGHVGYGQVQRGQQLSNNVARSRAVRRPSRERGAKEWAPGLVLSNVSAPRPGSRFESRELDSTCCVTKYSELVLTSRKKRKCCNHLWRAK